MQEHLVVRLTDDTAPVVEWALFDDRGRRLGPAGVSAATDLSDQALNRRVILLVPGVDVILTRVALPARSAARLRQMLPYSLEESVAQDVEQLFFAAGARLPSGAVQVAIVARETIERWLERAREAGLTPHAVYVDSEGVPDIPGTLVLVLEGERIHGRSPDAPPFVFDGLGLREALELVRGGIGGDAAGTDPTRVFVYADPAGHERRKAELGQLQAEGLEVDLRVMEQGALPHFAANLLAQPGINMLQGPYARSSDWIAQLRPWRSAAALAGALLLTSVLAQGAQLIGLQRQDAALTQQVAARCERSFDASELESCRMQVERRLAAAGQGLPRQAAGFLPTLSAIAQARDSAIRLTALSFRNGVMDVRVNAPNVPALDEFARELGGSGFQVQIQSANPSDAGVEGQLQVQGSGQ